MAMTWSTPIATAAQPCACRPARLHEEHEANVGLRVVVSYHAAVEFDDFIGDARLFHACRLTGNCGYWTNTRGLTKRLGRSLVQAGFPTSRAAAHGFLKTRQFHWGELPTDSVRARSNRQRRIPTWYQEADDYMSLAGPMERDHSRRDEVAVCATRGRIKKKTSIHIAISCAIGGPVGGSREFGGAWQINILKCNLTTTEAVFTKVASDPMQAIQQIYQSDETARRNHSHFFSPVECTKPRPRHASPKEQGHLTGSECHHRHHYVVAEL